MEGNDLQRRLRRLDAVGEVGNTLNFNNRLSDEATITHQPRRQALK